MAHGAVIVGPQEQRITDWEKAHFRDADPWGFILFARNVGDPEQLRRLTGELRESVGREAPIMIDQEGGRVQRMRSPHWREYLPALDQMERASDPMRAMWLRNRLIAQELHDVGIDANCAPLADLLEDEAHPVMRNRLYGRDVDTVVKTARTAAEAHLAGGVLPILKHIPGYGRATVDSHKELPTVRVPRKALEGRDFAPFVALNDMAMGMTAHIVFTDIDPDQPATTSKVMMQVIRNDIGFDGLIMTDDIGMDALTGTPAERARASLDAGCDLVLHCNGDRAEVEAVAAASGQMSASAMARAERALAQRKPPMPIDIPGAIAELEALLA